LARRVAITTIIVGTVAALAVIAVWTGRVPILNQRFEGWRDASGRGADPRAVPAEPVETLRIRAGEAVHGVCS
jgi:hypothetical protein